VKKERVMNLRCGILLLVMLVAAGVGQAQAQTESVLYSFTNSNGDGSTPAAGLIMDASGNLYGTTELGGTSSWGTVFELVYSNGSYTEKVLYSFTKSNGDGGYPQESLTRISHGRIEKGCPFLA